MTDNHQVQGRLFRLTDQGASELLRDVIGDPMAVYEQGREAVRALHAEQQLDPGVTDRMVARMAHLVDSPRQHPARSSSRTSSLTSPPCSCGP